MLDRYHRIAGIDCLISDRWSPVVGSSMTFTLPFLCNLLASLMRWHSPITHGLQLADDFIDGNVGKRLLDGHRRHVGD